MVTAPAGTARPPVFDGRAPGTPAQAWQADPRWGDLPAPRLPLTGTVVVIAAHPDDETLGAGGLVATLADAGRPAHVVVVTDGAASHPDSPTLTPAALVARRAAEVRDAVGHLSPDSPVTLLGHPDGATDEVRDAIRTDLAAALDAVGDLALVLAPYRGDAHRDHRVVGEVAAELAEQRGVPLWEYPIWLWHWADPAHELVPWSRLRALPLSASAALRTVRATRAHASQVVPLSADPRDAAPLHPAFVAGLDRDVALVVVPDGEPTAAPDAGLAADYFDGTYSRHEDPWGFVDRWYEERKRALTLAALPAARYRRALELGASIGVLTAELAQRCGELVATDTALAAVERARHRIQQRLGPASARFDVLQHDLRDPLPPGVFDLVVLSEVGYYLSRPALRGAVRRLLAALEPGGTLLACHWRHPVTDYPLTGDEVHRILAEELAGSLRRLVRHEEDDLLLEVWCADPRSVAQRTGLVP